MTYPLRTKLLAATCALSLALPQGVLADEMSDKAEILGIWEAYSAARVAGDAETWLGLWDAEAIRMAPGGPAVDFATFAPGTPARFANAPNSMVIDAAEVEIAGDWAYSRGTFTVNDAVEGKFLTIFRRQDDGSWRIYRDAFNMNAE